jgi:hypothetical protein
MKFAISALFALAMAGCASTNYQAYEGRTDQIIEGQGGTKEIVNGIELWDNGNPPRRYKVIGVATVEDFDNVFGQQRIRTAMANQVRQAGGNAAVMLDGYSQGQSTSVMVGPNGRTYVGGTSGRKQVRIQIVKYLDNPNAKPAAN